MGGQLLSFTLLPLDLPNLSCFMNRNIHEFFKFFTC